MDIVIIDDDSLVRRGIRMSIDWETIGCRVVGEASNGKAGLELIEKLHPQIALVDIKMPVMDGLELAKLLSESQPEVEVLILSGYSEFDYAREAMRAGVRNYLLKPVKAEELMGTVSEIKRDREKNQEAIRQLEEERKIMGENRELLRSHFLESVVSDTGLLQEEELYRRADELKCVFTGPYYQVMMIDIDDYSAVVPSACSSQLAQIHRKILQLFEKRFRAAGTANYFLTRENYLCVIMNLEEKTEQILLEDCRNFQNQTKNLLNMTVTIALGDRKTSVLEISDSYTKAMSALKTKFYYGKNSLIEFCAIDLSQRGGTVDLREEEQELIDAVKTLDESRSLFLIDKIFTKMKNSSLRSETAQNVIVSLVITVLKSTENLGVDFQDVLGKNANILEELNHCRIVEDMKLWTESFAAKLISLIRAVHDYPYSYVVAAAMKYVSQHYSEEIKIEMLAELVHVTPNYFSRIWSRETGQRFIDYLNQYRIEKSKLLLQTKQYKTYEVAELCGYSNYKYFSTSFKKYENCSPKQYQEQSEHYEQKRK